MKAHKLIGTDQALCGETSWYTLRSCWDTVTCKKCLKLMPDREKFGIFPAFQRGGIEVERKPKV